MAGLKVYYDFLSQPCRAVYVFLKINKVPFTHKALALRKGEHFLEEFTKVNRFQKVPAIDDNGFVIRESIPILKYLRQKYNLEDHWYPSDFEQQIRVDEYLHWHHANTRLNSAMVFRPILIEPKMTGKPINWKKVDYFRGEVPKTVEHMEKAFLQDGPYLGNLEKMSICDIVAACELMQLNAVHEEYLYENNPTVKKWFERVKKDLDPYFDEAHQIVYRAREVYGKMKANL